jgi:hypothetical protein
MRAFVVVLSVWTLMCGGPAAAVHGQETPRDAWNTFSGTWSAVGRRQTLRTEGGRPAAIIQLSGSVVLTGSGRSGDSGGSGGSGTSGGLSSAFRAEAIGFDDGDQIGVGRAVWTDTRGDLVFSVLKGERLETGRRITATITGGTGRYAGLTGDWELTWQFVVATDDGEVQGRAVDLKGRFRHAETPQ